ncbi:MAG: tetratricopeptide repeat protein [Defluviitaleaceae bacterium]|nr:tetratricopeptide repeat protein [Defluviitaleaceae bacterium]
MLQLCISQQTNDIPFTFGATGIRVFSIEETLYHVYHHWRESVEDYLSPKMIAWVESLGHAALAKEMKGFCRLESLSKRMLAFLGIIDYFDSEELTSLKTDLESWEHRVEWERLKDRADRLVSKGDAVRALPLYRHALKYENNAQLLNNMAVAYMHLAKHKEAAQLLAEAYTAWPDNQALSLHYAEAAILSGDYDNAAVVLEKITASHPNNADVMLLRSLMARRQEDYPLAIEWLKKAAKDNPGSNSQLADIYMQMGQYDKALECMDINTPGYHAKAAEIYAARGHTHIPDAIQHMRKAIDAKNNQNDAALWAKLAKYYRLDYDWQRAGEAIANAMPTENPAIQLENARIKKGQGRMRDYRAGLSDVVAGLKNKYRSGDTEINF